MPQGKKIPKEIIEKVRGLLLENENLIGKQVKENVEADNPEIKFSLRAYQSIIRKELPKIRTLKSSLPETPWSLGTLVNTNDITPEAIPHILAIQDWASKQKERFTEKPYPPINVCQGKWLSRLLPMFLKMRQEELDNILKDKKKRKKEDKVIAGEKVINSYWYLLWTWSKIYAISERLYELSGKKEKGEAFDSRFLDEALYRGDIVETFGDTYTISSRDGQTRNWIGTADKKLLEQIMNMREGEVNER